MQDQVLEVAIALGGMTMHSNRLPVEVCIRIAWESAIHLRCSTCARALIGAHLARIFCPPGRRVAWRTTPTLVLETSEGNVPLIRMRGAADPLNLDGRGEGVARGHYGHWVAVHRDNEWVAMRNLRMEYSQLRWYKCFFMAEGGLRYACLECFLEMRRMRRAFYLLRDRWRHGKK